MFRATKTSEELDDALPSEEEKALIVQLRKAFQEEFTKREAEGRDYPCFFGELALARVLRGNDGDLESARKWYTTFLEKMKQYDVDDMVINLSKKLDESGSDFCSRSLLPYHEEVQEFFNITLTAPNLTPRGDVIQYAPMVDFDKRGIVEEVDWSHWVKFNRSAMIMRCLECDRLSRKQGRMVRCITIVDVEGSTMDTLFFSGFDRDHEEDVSRFNREMCAEIMGPLYVVNASWKISTLWSVVKRFAPDKMVRKIQFHRGDTFSDAEFVSLMGGREQLENLFATRQGLTLNRESEEYIESDALATDRELEMMAMLREELKEEFEKRASEDLLYPFFFGDIALTRVIRGNNGSYRAAVKWLRGFLQRLEEWGVDALIRDLKEGLRDTEPPVVPAVKYLPHRAELHAFFRAIMSAPRPTPTGDIICYVALSDVDRDGILQKVQWDHWVRFARSMALLDVMACDQQSNIQGRIVKVVNVWDFTGFGVTSMRHPEWNEGNSRDVESFMEHVCIEMAGPQYVLNAPWLLVRLFNLFSSFMPEKFTRKFHIMSSDGTSDPEFVELMGGMEQLQELLASRVGLCDDLADQPSGEQDIVAGRSFEKFQDILEGQQVNWSFSLLAGYGDTLFGTSDVEFSVMFYCIAEIAPAESAASEPSEPAVEAQSTESAASAPGDAAATAEPERVDVDDGLEVVAPTRYTPARGEVTGNYTATRSGYLLIRWSNEHSTVRGKTIQYSVEVAKGASTDTAVSTEQSKPES